MTASPYVSRRSRLHPASQMGPVIGRLDIELTERCNNDCVHCCINRPAEDADARSREMSTARIIDLLQQVTDLGCLSVRFTGGEPLLRSDFPEIYIGARRLGLKVILFTNATLVSQSLAKLLAEIPPLAPVEISVYGMRPDSYDAVTRRPGSFRKFRQGMNRLVEKGIPLVVKSVLLPQLVSEREEFETWARTLPREDRAPGYATTLDLRGRRDDDSKNVQISALRLPAPAVIEHLTRDAESYRNGMAQFAERFMTQPDDRLFRCGASHGISVDAYGRAQPCIGVRDPEYTIGLSPAAKRPAGSSAAGDGKEDRDRSQMSLAAAAESFRELRKLRATNPLYISRCARCFLKDLCEQCPAKSWAESGTLDTPVPYLCEIAHAQARYLGWLNEGETGWEVGSWETRSAAGDGRLRV